MVFSYLLLFYICSIVSPTFFTTPKPAIRQHASFRYNNLSEN